MSQRRSPTRTSTKSSSTPPPVVSPSQHDGDAIEPHQHRVSEFLRKVDRTRPVPEQDMKFISNADILSTDAPLLRRLARKPKDGMIRSSHQGVFSGLNLKLKNAHTANSSAPDGLGGIVERGKTTTKAKRMEQQQQQSEDEEAGGGREEEEKKGKSMGKGDGLARDKEAAMTSSRKSGTSHCLSLPKGSRKAAVGGGGRRRREGGGTSGRDSSIHTESSLFDDSEGTVLISRVPRLHPPSVINSTTLGSMMDGVVKTPSYLVEAGEEGGRKGRKKSSPRSSSLFGEKIGRSGIDLTTAGVVSSPPNNNNNNDDDDGEGRGGKKNTSKPKREKNPTASSPRRSPSKKKRSTRAQDNQTISNTSVDGTVSSPDSFFNHHSIRASTTSFSSSSPVRRNSKKSKEKRRSTQGKGGGKKETSSGSIEQDVDEQKPKGERKKKRGKSSSRKSSSKSPHSTENSSFSFNGHRRRTDASVLDSRESITDRLLGSPAYFSPSSPIQGGNLLQNSKSGKGKAEENGARRRSMGSPASGSTNYATITATTSTSSRTSSRTSNNKNPRGGGGGSSEELEAEEHPSYVIKTHHSPPSPPPSAFHPLRHRQHFVTVDDRGRGNAGVVVAGGLGGAETANPIDDDDPPSPILTGPSSRSNPSPSAPSSRRHRSSSSMMRILQHALENEEEEEGGEGTTTITTTHQVKKIFHMEVEEKEVSNNEEEEVKEEHGGRGNKKMKKSTHSPIPQGKHIGRARMQNPRKKMEKSVEKDAKAHPYSPTRSHTSTRTTTAKKKSVRASPARSPSVSRGRSSPRMKDGGGSRSPSRKSTRNPSTARPLSFPQKGGHGGGADTEADKTKGEHPRSNPSSLSSLPQAPSSFNEGGEEKKDGDEDEHRRVNRHEASDGDRVKITTATTTAEEEQDNTTNGNKKATKTKKKAQNTAPAIPVDLSPFLESAVGSRRGQSHPLRKHRRGVFRDERRRGKTGGVDEEEEEEEKEEEGKEEEQEEGGEVVGRGGVGWKSGKGRSRGESIGIGGKATAGGGGHRRRRILRVVPQKRKPKILPPPSPSRHRSRSVGYSPSTPRRPLPLPPHPERPDKEEEGGGGKGVPHQRGGLGHESSSSSSFPRHSRREDSIIRRKGKGVDGRGGSERGREEEKDVDVEEWRSDRWGENQDSFIGADSFSFSPHSLRSSTLPRNHMERDRRHPHSGGGVLDNMRRDLERIVKDIKAMGEDPPYAPPPSSSRFSSFTGGVGGLSPPPFSIGATMNSSFPSSYPTSAQCQPQYSHHHRVSAAASMPPFLPSSSTTTVEILPQILQQHPQLGYSSSSFFPSGFSSPLVLAPDRCSASWASGGGVGGGGEAEEEEKGKKESGGSSQSPITTTASPTETAPSANSGLTPPHHHGTMTTIGGGVEGNVGGAPLAFSPPRVGPRHPSLPPLLSSRALSPFTPTMPLGKSSPSSPGAPGSASVAGRNTGQHRRHKKYLSSAISEDVGSLAGSAAGSVGGGGGRGTPGALAGLLQPAPSLSHLHPLPLPSLPQPIPISSSAFSIRMNGASSSPPPSSVVVQPTSYDVAASLPTDGSSIPAQLLVGRDSYLIIPVEIGEDDGAVRLPPGCQPSPSPWISSFLPASTPLLDRKSRVAGGGGGSISSAAASVNLLPTPSSPFPFGKTPPRTYSSSSQVPPPPPPHRAGRGGGGTGGRGGGDVPPSISTLRNEIACLTDEVAESLRQCYDALSTATAAAKTAPESEQQYFRRLVEAREQVWKDAKSTSEHVASVLQSLLNALEKLELDEEEENGGGGDGGRAMDLHAENDVVRMDDLDVEDSVSQAGMLDVARAGGGGGPNSTPPLTTAGGIATIIRQMRQEFLQTQTSNDHTWKTVEQELAEEDAKHREAIAILLSHHRQQRRHRHHHHHHHRHPHDHVEDEDDDDDGGGGDACGSLSKRKKKSSKKKLEIKKPKKRMKNRKTSTAASWIVPPTDVRVDKDGSLLEAAGETAAKKGEYMTADRLSILSRYVQVPSPGFEEGEWEEGRTTSFAAVPPLERRDASCSPHSVFLDLLENDKKRRTSSQEWLKLKSTGSGTHLLGSERSCSFSSSSSSSPSVLASPLYHRAKGSPGSKFLSARDQGKENGKVRRGSDDDNALNTDPNGKKKKNLNKRKRSQQKREGKSPSSPLGAAAVLDTSLDEQERIDGVFLPLRRDVIWVFHPEEPSEENETLEVVKLWRNGLPPAPSPLPSESDVEEVEEEEEEEEGGEAQENEDEDGHDSSNNSGKMKDAKRLSDDPNKLPKKKKKIRRWGGGGRGAPAAVTTWMKDPTGGTEASTMSISTIEGKRRRARASRPALNNGAPGSLFPSNDAGVPPSFPSPPVVEQQQNQYYYYYPTNGGDASHQEIQPPHPPSYGFPPPLAVGVPIEHRNQMGGRGVGGVGGYSPYVSSHPAPAPPPPPSSFSPLSSAGGGGGNSGSTVLHLGRGTQTSFFILPPPPHTFGGGSGSVEGNTTNHILLPSPQFPALPTPLPVPVEVRENAENANEEEEKNLNSNINPQFLPEPDEEQRRALYGSGASYISGNDRDGKKDKTKKFHKK